MFRRIRLPELDPVNTTAKIQDIPQLAIAELEWMFYDMVADSNVYLIVRARIAQFIDSEVLDQFGGWLEFGRNQMQTYSYQLREVCGSCTLSQETGATLSEEEVSIGQI